MQPTVEFHGPVLASALSALFQSRLLERHILICAMTAALSVVAAAKAAAQGKPAENPTTSRIQKRVYHFEEAGKEMEYGLFVPSTYDGTKKVPLIVALHGLGSNPQRILRYHGLTDLAERHGYVVAAPMGYNPFGWYGAPSPFARKTNPDNLGELSEKDVMNVLALVRRDFAIDSNCMYLMGHSMGGGGVWHLGLKHPDLWAGLAPIAPAIYRQPDGLEKISHVPVILIQGARDWIVPPKGARRWAERMRELKMIHEYVEVPGGGHDDVAIEKLPKVFEFFNRHRKSADVGRRPQ